MPRRAGRSDRPGDRSRAGELLEERRLLGALRRADHHLRLDQATSLWLPVSLVEKMYDSQDEKEIDGKGTFKGWRFAPRGK